MGKKWETLKKHMTKRLTAGLLCLIMLASYMPAEVYAAEPDNADEPYSEMLNVSEETVIPEAVSAQEAEDEMLTVSGEEPDDAEEPIPAEEAAETEDADAAENPDDADAPELLNEGRPTVKANDGPFMITYVDGIIEDNGVYYVADGAANIKVSVSTDKNIASDENYGIKGVKATIGGNEAAVYNGENAASAEGEYTIRISENSTDPITANVVISVETAPIHFVDFNTGGVEFISCAPDGGSFIPNADFNTQHGVFVFDNESLSFHFGVNRGYRIAGVTQGENGDELFAKGLDSCTKTGTVIQTGQYTTGAITENTTIYVGYETKKLHFVNFETKQNADKIACVPDGGDYVANKNFNDEHGVCVYAGGTLSFHFDSSDCTVTKVLQGRKELGAVYNGQYKQYTTTAITADTTISYENTAGTEENNVVSWADGPYRVTILEGADPATGVINAEAKSIKVQIETDKSPEKNAENYGIVRDGVTAKIGSADATIVHDYGNINLTDGEYVIKLSDDSVIASDVEILVETQKVHFVGFHSGEFAHGIGCEPVFAKDGENNPQYNHIGTSPWIGGVYVYDGKPMSFRLNPNYGITVTGVRQGNHGAELDYPESPDPSDPEQEKFFREQSYSTGVFTTSPISKRTYLYTESRLERQVIFTNEDRVEYRFGAGCAAVDESLREKSGKCFIRANDGDLIVKVRAKDGNQIESLAYRTIHLYAYDEKIEENNWDTKIGYEQATGYTPTTKIYPEPVTPEGELTEELGNYEDSDGYSYYRIPVPVRSEGDDWSVLGVEISANVTEMAKVVVEAEGSDRFCKCLNYYDVTLRVGSETYPLEAVYKEGGAEIKGYYAYVPKNVTATVCVKYLDNLWTVKGVRADDDSKTSGKLQKANKTNEYPLVIGPARDQATLTLETDTATRLIVADHKGATVSADFPEPGAAELSAAGGKYVLDASESFTVYVAAGSRVVAHDGVTELLPFIQPDTVFKNGRQAFGAGQTTINEEGVFVSNGAALGTNKLTLNATLDGKTYTANFTFFNPPTEVKITSPTPVYGEVKVDYGKKATIKVDYNQGADAKGVTAWIGEWIEESEGVYKPKPLAPVTDIGTFDGKTITIDPAKGKKHPDLYKPDTLLLAFYHAGADPLTNADEGLIDEFSLTYVAPALSAAPTVKVNDALATNLALGLSLALPKGVKAMEGLYYRIIAQVPDEELSALIPEDGQIEAYYPELAYVYDMEGGQKGLSKVYLRETTVYVPASEKSVVLSVADNPRTVEDGHRIHYRVTASLVYALEDGSEPGGYKAMEESEPAEPVDAFTRDNTFETRLTVLRKAPVRIYNGQTNVPIAIPKWSKTTTVQGLERVELKNEYGNGRGNWDRWNGSNDYGCLISVDPDTGLVSLDTLDRTDRDEDGDGESDVFYLEPGKYTMEFYAIGGPGQQAFTSMPITVNESIRDIRVDAPERVLKLYNKAATVKTNIYFNTNDWDRPPATRNVTWSIVQINRETLDPLYREIPADSPLYGRISVKNGTATIDAKLLVDLAKYDAEDYSFVIAATAADWEGNEVTGYSDPIRITSREQIPTEIQFVWDEYRWDDGSQQEIFVRRNYSPVTEAEIARKAAEAKAKLPWAEPFFSNAIQHTRVLVVDQYGDLMNASLKLSGIRQDERGELILDKPGKVTVTATSTDGGKKSKSLSFTIAAGDARFTPNVVIQDASRNSDYQRAIINVPAGEGEEPDPRRTGGEKECTNTLPANRYLYVHVAGVRYADKDDKGKAEPWDGDPNYDDSVMFNHTVKITGGTIKATLTGDFYGNYTTYVVQPTASLTTVKLTDNTVDKISGRQKTDHEYKIYNTAISDEKTAIKITPDKKSILSFMNITDSAYPDESDRPNHVFYKIENGKAVSPGKEAVVLLTMDEPVTHGDWNIARMIGLSDSDGVYESAEDGWFELSFYEIHEDVYAKWYEFDETPVGTYNIYVTYGEADDTSGTNFKPLAKQVKVPVKVENAPAPTLQFANTGYKLSEGAMPGGESGFRATVAAPVIKNGVGIFTGDDPEWDPCYQTRSTNTGGLTNCFADLFEVTADVDEESILSDEEATLSIRDDFWGNSEELRDQWIMVGSGKSARWIRLTSWYDLYFLKNGKFTVEGEDGEEFYDDDEDTAFPAGTPAAQKKAYQTWISNNCTGFISCRVIGYDGRHTEIVTKVTVDIEAFIDSCQPQP